MYNRNQHINKTVKYRLKIKDNLVTITNNNNGEQYLKKIIYSYLKSINT